MPAKQALEADPQAGVIAAASLKPYDRNARLHSERQVDQIIASINEFGFTNPVLIDEKDRLIAGHGRLLAAQKMGLETVPYRRIAGLTEAQRRALVLADNQLALNATWDEALLTAELQALNGLDFNLDLLGFDDTALVSFLADKGGKTDPDDVPEVPVEPVSQLGDLWIMGDHRLICGDSCNPITVDALLDGAEPGLMVTDPPYGVSYDPSWRERELDTWKAPRATGKVENDDQADWTEAWKLFPGAVAYVWHGGLHSGEVERSLQAVGFEMRSQIIWTKQHFVISRGDYHWQHEPCWYAVRKGKPGRYGGGRKQSTVWDIQNASAMGGQADDGTTGHGTQKPVECMARPIRNNSKPGEAVYEPFSGSGTTIIAAHIEARRCYAIELMPAYVDVAVRRWCEFTGHDAKRATDGASFRSLAGMEP